MAGAVIAALGFAITFRLLGLVVVIVSALLWAWAAYPRSPAAERPNAANPELRPSRATESR